MAQELDGVKTFLRKAAEKQGVEYNEAGESDFIKSYNNDYGKLVDEVGARMGFKPDELPKFRERAFKEYSITSPTDTDRYPTDTPLSEEAKSSQKLAEDKAAFRINPRVAMSMPVERAKEIAESAADTQTEDWKGFGKELGLQAKSSMNDLTAGIYGTPGLVYDFIGSGFRALGIPVPEWDESVFTKEVEAGGRDYNPISILGKSKDILLQASKDNTEKVIEQNPDYIKGVQGAFADGNVQKGVRNIFSSVVRSAAPSAAMMMTGGLSSAAGMGASTAVFGSMNLNEADQKQDYGNLGRDGVVAVSALTGAIEYIFERNLGSGATGKAISKILKKEGKEEVTRKVKREWNDAMADMLVKNPWLAPFGESYEEMGTQIAQNLVNKYSGYTPNINITDGIIDAGLIGGVSGGMHYGMISAAKKGGAFVMTTPQRIKTKKDYKKAGELLADIPNDQYTTDIQNATENITNPQELIAAYVEINDIHKENISEEDILKARYFVSSTIQHNQMINGRDDQIDNNITKFQDKNGNVSKATIDGKEWYISNPQDIGTGKVIFGTNEAGETKGFPSQKVTEAVTKTPDEIRNDVIMTDEFLEQEAEKQKAIQQDAADRGIVVNQTAVGPHGKGTVISINEDGTITMADTGGDTMEVQMNEVEPFKTTEQKAAEQEQAQAEKDAQDALMEGIEEGAEIESDEEQSGVRIINFSNGQSKVITAEVDQVFDTPEQRDNAIKAIVEAKVTETQAKLDDLSPEEAFEQLRVEDEEVAAEIFQDEIKEVVSNAKQLRADSKKSKSRDEKAALLKQAKQLEAEAQRLEDVLHKPEQQRLVNQAETLALELQSEIDNAPYNQLEPWQQDLLSRDFNIDSFNRYADPNEVDPELRRVWIAPKKDKDLSTKNIDTTAIELSEIANVEITPKMIVDFILANRKKDVPKTTDRVNEIKAEYKTLTGKAIGTHEAFIQESGLIPESTIPVSEDPQAIAYEEGVAKLKEAGYTDEQIARMNETLPAATAKEATEEVFGEKETDDIPFRATEPAETVKPVTDEKPIEQIGQVEGDVAKAEDAKKKAKRKRIGKGLEEDVTLDVSDKATDDINLKKRGNAKKALIKIADEFGIPVKVIHSSEISEGAKKKQRLSGATPEAYYEGGVAYIISDKIRSVTHAKESYLHEAILHKGLDILFNKGSVTLLGKEYNSKDELLLEVFNRLDSETIAAKAKEYGIKIKEGKELSDKQKLEISEEVLATLNQMESMPSRLKVFIDSLWKKIKKLAGQTSTQFTKQDFLNMLSEHRRLLKETVKRETIARKEAKKLAESDKKLETTLGKVPKTAKDKADIQRTKDLVTAESLQKEKPTPESDLQKQELGTVRFRTEEQSKIIQDAKKYDDVHDFYQAYDESNFRDMHRAPGDSKSDQTVEERMDEGDDFSLVEVSQGYSTQPSDYFDPRVGARYYGYSDFEGQESYNAIREAMTSINEQLMESEEVQDIPMIMAYRSVPNSVDTDVLNDGDWITFSEQYAINHGEARFGEDEYKLITEEVPADEVWWDGNDINEWGYDTGETEFLGKSDLKRIWEEANTESMFRAQTKTPEFKNWFGDSKVVDEKGEPLVVYHGTRADFDKFGTEKTGFANKHRMWYFTNDVEMASTHAGGSKEAFENIGTTGSIMPVFLSIKNPKILDSKRQDDIDVIEDIGYWATDEQLNEFEEQGFDGLMLDDMSQIIALNPTQIKSATANIGTFDPEKADIRFRVAENKQEIDDFVKDSKVKETVYHGTRSEFDKFELEQAGREGDFGQIGKGFYFTTDKQNAENYARNSEGHGEPRVIESNLSIKKMYDWKKTIDSTKMLSEKQANKITDDLKSKGYDGIKYDTGYGFEWHVVFEPNQILINKSEDTRFKVDQAASETDTNPSDAQKHAGNYKMGHVAFDGFDISIENPKGSIRSGKDKTGKEWSREMPVDYGYFKGTIGRDKDHIDVFIGENPESDKIYVIDQIDPSTGKFDEHKIMLGFDNVSKARNTYNSAYEEGWTGLGQITRTDKDGLKEWFKGDTKKPYASDVKFRITEETTSPEIAALFERLSALEKVSKATTKVKDLEEEKRVSPTFEKPEIEKQIKDFKEGVKAGAKDTKEQLLTIQTAIVNYAKANMPLDEAGKRDVGAIMTAIKDANTPGKIEKAFEKIDELTGKVTSKSIRNKNIGHVKRLMKWMKNTDKFVYANNVEFKKFRETDRETIKQQKIKNSPNSTEAQKKAADNELDRMWNELDTKTEERTMLENIQMKLIEYRRNKDDASDELVASIREDLQVVYDAAKDARKDENIQKAIDRKSDREFVKGLIADTPLKNENWNKQARASVNNWAIDSMGNWETLLNQIGGQKLRDKFSFILKQANQEVSRQATFDKVLDQARESYGFKTKEEMLKHLQQLKKKDFTLVKPNREGERGQGQDQELSRMDIMDLYNATKNENIRGDAYMTYGDISLAEDGSRDTEAQKESGKERIDGLIDNLSDADKAFADDMQVAVDSYYSKINEVFIKSKNRDLPKMDNYWPSSAEFANENDAFEQFRQDSMHPSATKERTTHRSVKVADAFDKFVNHVKSGEWYANMALPVTRMNNILKNPNVKDLIIEARGEEFYKTMITHLQEQGLNPPSKAVAPTGIENVASTVLNNWVTAAIGLSPSVPVKQLLSVINYSENMPAGKWATGFAKAMVDPVETWKEMMKIPYLKTRIGTGYSEALQYVMNADSMAPKAATGWQKMKNYMTAGTRYGDIAAIVFGGKPYLDYLINEKGMPYKEAVDQFLLDTLRSQQSPFSSSLSTWQNSKNVIKRSIFAFSNTPSQYMRKMFEANEAYRKGDIDKGQLSKVYAIYGFLSSMNYVVVGALMSALLSGKDWDDDLLEKIMVQFGISAVGGLPIVKDLAEGVGRTLVGLDVYDDVSPILEGANKLVEVGNKLANADEDTDTKKLIMTGVKYLAPFAGISARNIEKVYNATINRSATFDKARVKKTDKNLTEIAGFKREKDAELKQGNQDPSFIKFQKSKPDYKLAQSATNMKSAYSSAKRKASEFESDKKGAKSERLLELIESSKSSLAKTDYGYTDIESELRQFNRLVKIYSK